MRQYLVTRFMCTDCGNPLNLEYEGTKSNIEPVYDSVVTGALKVENKIYIEPCRTCLGHARAPLEKMREALASLKEI